MDVASQHPSPIFPGKRSFTTGFSQPPATKRFKYEQQTSALWPPPPSLKTSLNFFGHGGDGDGDNSSNSSSIIINNFSADNTSIKRSADHTDQTQPDFINATSKKRTKLDPELRAQQDEETSPCKTDFDGDILMVVSEEEGGEETEIDEEDHEEAARSLLFRQSDDNILENILGFMDSICLRRYRAVSKLWKKHSEDILVDRQLLAAAEDPVVVAKNSGNIQWKQFPRLVFDAQFRVINRGIGNYFPHGVWDDNNDDNSINNKINSSHNNNLHIEISGISWNGCLRSLNITNAYSNHLVNLITRNLNCNDGLYHDLKILIERGRVFLKLDQHWLPGTIPVRELAKLLVICKWKGLTSSSSSSSSPPPSTYDEEQDVMAEASANDPCCFLEGEIMED